MNDKDTQPDLTEDGDQITGGQTKSGRQFITVTADGQDMRLDRYLQNFAPHVGYGRIQSLIRKGEVRLDGGRVKADCRLEAGQMIKLSPHFQPSSDKERERPHKQTMAGAEQLANDLLELVLYQNDDLIIINKPAGLAVQGGSGTKRHIDGALMALGQKLGLKTHKIEDGQGLRLVHRLDRETSGCLVIAKSRAAAHKLTKAFAARIVEKLYLAVCVGELPMTQGHIDIAIGIEGRPAQTDYDRLDHAGALSLMLAKPRTGRNHQIRAHFAAIGCPLLGDRKYGDMESRDAITADMNKILHLHAIAVTLPEGVAGAGTRINAPLPAAFAQNLKWFGMDAKGWKQSELADQD